MTTKDTSGSAFPHSKDQHAAYTTYFPGLTKREWYAGMAMQGMMPLHWHREYAVVAEMAFAMADAMLAEGSRQ